MKQPLALSTGATANLANFALITAVVPHARIST